MSPPINIPDMKGNIKTYMDISVLNNKMLLVSFIIININENRAKFRELSVTYAVRTSFVFLSASGHIILIAWDETKPGIKNITMK